MRKSKIIINEYMEDGKISMYDGKVIMNKTTYNKISKQLDRKQSKFRKFIIHILYKIDDGLTILYYKTHIKLFETIGAYIGGLGNKINKEFGNE